MKIRSGFVSNSSSSSFVLTINLNNKDLANWLLENMKEFQLKNFKKAIVKNLKHYELQNKKIEKRIKRKEFIFWNDTDENKKLINKYTKLLEAIDRLDTVTLVYEAIWMYCCQCHLSENNFGQSEINGWMMMDNGDDLDIGEFLLKIKIELEKSDYIVEEQRYSDQ